MSETFKHNLIMYPKALLRTTVIIINNIYCLPTYFIWMTLLLPVKRYQPDLYYRIEGLFFHWLLSLVAMWSWSAGYGVVECGDDLAPCRGRKRRTLIIANHQSTADVPLMMACFNAKPDVLPNIMWIMERLFKYTNFGLVSLIHQDFFISSGRDNREHSVQALKDHIVNSFVPRMRNWMVLFPEGGFLHKRREVSRRYAAKHGLPDLQHVSLPRVGALKAILSELPARPQPGNNNDTPAEEVEQLLQQADVKLAHSLLSNGGGGEKTPTSEKAAPVQPETPTATAQQNGNGVGGGAERETQPTSTSQARTDAETDPAAAPNATYLDYILDITIAYPQGKPLDLPSIVTGMRDAFDTHFLYRLFPTSQIPNDEAGLTQWLFDRWSEKELLLDEFYRTGSFGRLHGGVELSAGQRVEQDMLRFVIINLFFMTSSYVHLQMLYAMVGYANSLCVYTML